MTQMFARGLDDAFVAALNELYDRPDSWWRPFVDDSSLFVAIRNNYVNVYYRGCSLVRLVWNGSQVNGEIHYKYLLKPDVAGPQYVPVVDGSADLGQALGHFFHTDIRDVGRLKQAARPYCGLEKAGVHDIVLANTNVLDVEIAFSAARSADDTPSTPRVDFAALRAADNVAKLVFFEAKHFTNTGSLRVGASDAHPPVVAQINGYSRLLEQNRDAVEHSYRHVCRNLVALKGMAARNQERHALAQAVSDGSLELSVDEHPRLVIFGFDADQKAGSTWEPHRLKLEQAIEGRVFLAGATKGFVRGISMN